MNETSCHRAPPPGVCLLLVDPARLPAMRSLLHQIAAPCRIEVGADPLDGLLTALRLPADLVVIDAAVGAGIAPAMTRHIAHLAPEAAVLVLDDLEADHRETETHPWHQAPELIRRWRAALDLRHGSAVEGAR